MDEPVNRTQQTSSGPLETPPKGRPKRRGWTGWLLLLAAVVAGYFIYQRIESLRPARRGGGLPPQSVGTAAAVTGDMPITLAALGTVTPLDVVNVQTQVAGQLQKLGFAQGQMVKAGAFLAQIDPRPFQAALEQTQATLKRDTAALAQAQADLVRYQTLNRQDSISKQQVQDQEFLVEQNKASVAVDKANVDTAQLNLSYCRIVSPIDGLAGLQQVDVGNYLQPSAAAPIVTIAQLEPISVIFAIPQQDLPQVRARMKTGAQLPVTALDQTASHALASGVLTATDSQISTSTGTVNLKATFPNKQDVLFPNQFVNVNLLVDTEKNVVLVPNPAIQRGAPGTFVYLVNANGTVSVQKVQIGASDANNTVVSSGLKVGQSVVVDGADRLSDGARIVVRNGAPAAGSASPPAQPGAGGASSGRSGRRGKGKAKPGAAPQGAPNAPPQ